MVLGLRCHWGLIEKQAGDVRGPDAFGNSLWFCREWLPRGRAGVAPEWTEDCDCTGESEDLWEVKAVGESNYSI